MKKCYFLLILCTLVIAIALMLTACSKRATGPAGPQGSAGLQGAPGTPGARIILIPGGVLGTSIDPHSLTYNAVCKKHGIQP